MAPKDSPVPRWHSVLGKGDTLLVAVSGGADSVAMLLALADEAPRLGVRLRVAHVHHHLRGAAADEDARFVESLAARLALPFALLHLDDEEMQRRPGASTSLEARLREERLRLLRAEARRTGARAIALGHTADDAAETFLLMALRGSGPAGLGSLREVRRLPGEDDLYLVRPLLDRTKAELIADLRRRGQTWREDASNESAAMRRNRLRAEVLPLLESIEPGAGALLARAAQWCAEEAELLADLAGESLAPAAVSRAARSVLVDADAVRALAPPLAKAALRLLWIDVQRAAFGPDHVCLPPSREIAESLAMRLQRPTGEESRFGPSQGVAALLAGSDLLIHDGNVDAAGEFAAHIAAARRAMLLPAGAAPVPVLNSTQRYTPGRYEVLLPCGQGVLAADVVPAADFRADWQADEFRAHAAAAIDCRTVRRDLYLRTAAPGERLPIGGGQSKDVAAVLQEARVPAALRERVAVLADDRGPLWIPRIRRAASGHVTPRTELVLVLRWPALDSDTK